MIITQPDRVLLARQIKEYGPRLSGSLLDVGAGRVRRYASYLPHIQSYQTLDANPNSGADIVGSAEAIPLESESKDSILCTQVLEHVPHPQKAVAEMFRILRSGGYCLLTAPQMNELHEEPHDYFRYTCHGFRQILEDAGFKVIQIDQRGRYPATIMQLRIRHMINTWKPYENRMTMLILAPLTYLLTRFALWRDSSSRNPADTLDTIGWCVLAQKP